MLLIMCHWLEREVFQRVYWFGNKSKMLKTLKVKVLKKKKEERAWTMSEFRKQKAWRLLFERQNIIVKEEIFYIG